MLVLRSGADLQEHIAHIERSRNAEARLFAATVDKQSWPSDECFAQHQAGLGRSLVLVVATILRAAQCPIDTGR